MNTKLLVVILALILGYPIIKQQSTPPSTQYFWYSYTQDLDLQRLKAPASFCVIDSVVFTYTHRSFNRIPSYAPVDTVFVGKGFPICSEEIGRYYTRRLMKVPTASGLKDSIILIKPRIK